MVEGKWRVRGLLVKMQFPLRKVRQMDEDTRHLGRRRCYVEFGCKVGKRTRQKHTCIEV